MYSEELITSFEECYRLANEIVSTHEEELALQKLEELHDVLFQRGLVEDEQIESNLNMHDCSLYYVQKQLEAYRKYKKELQELTSLNSSKQKRCYALLETLLIFAMILLQVTHGEEIDSHKLRDLELNLLPFVFLSSVITPCTLRNVGLNKVWSVFLRKCCEINTNVEDVNIKKINNSVDKLQRVFNLWFKSYGWNFMLIEETCAVKHHVNEVDQSLNKQTQHVENKNENFWRKEWELPSNISEVIGSPSLSERVEVMERQHKLPSSITSVTNKITSKLPNYLVRKRFDPIKRFTPRCTAAPIVKDVNCTNLNLNCLNIKNMTIKYNNTEMRPVYKFNEYETERKTFDESNNNSNFDDSNSNSLSFMQYHTPVKKRRRDDENCDIVIPPTP